MGKFEGQWNAINGQAGENARKMPSDIPHCLKRVGRVKLKLEIF
jgi:hypothetical protein